MSFRKKIKFYLVHTLNYTNKGADKIIASGTLSINGNIIVQNEILNDEDEVKLVGETIKVGNIYEYYALNKPAGIESSFNNKIKNNLSTVFPFNGIYFIAGRLDKASEGLMLISNDGKWVNELVKPESKKEKEYEVEVDKIITDEFVTLMSRGVDIGICVTQSCVVRKLNETKFNIVLTEGKNRQIRRMCWKLGFKVKALKRVRIDRFYLSDIQGDKFKLTNI